MPGGIGGTGTTSTRPTPSRRSTKSGMRIRRIATIDRPGSYYDIASSAATAAASIRASPRARWSGRRPACGRSRQLEIGDLVLAQNVDTGELAYKPIDRPHGAPAEPDRARSPSTAKRSRPRSGHPFWVAGIGWRMAKELADGAISSRSERPVRRSDALSRADDAEAYNLVVADFSTYFVGTSGVLVHDNTPRRRAPGSCRAWPPSNQRASHYGDCAESSCSCTAIFELACPCNHFQRLRPVIGRDDSVATPVSRTSFSKGTRRWLLLL